MPVARTDLPLPSTLTDSAICVSAVLRSALAARVDIAASFKSVAYTKSELGEGFAERSEATPVLFRSPDCEADTTVEERYTGVQVLDEHAATLHAFKHGGRVGDANQDEVRIARKNRHAGKLPQLGVEPRSFSDDVFRLSIEHVVVRENPLGDGVGERIDVIGRANLVEFADPFRPPHRVAQAYTRQTQLRERAHDDE